MLLLIPGLSQSVINLDIEVVFFKVDKGPLEDAAALFGAIAPVLLPTILAIFI